MSELGKAQLVFGIPDMLVEIANALTSLGMNRHAIALERVCKGFSQIIRNKLTTLMCGSHNINFNWLYRYKCLVRCDIPIVVDVGNIHTISHLEMKYITIIIIHNGWEPIQRVIEFMKDDDARNVLTKLMTNCTAFDILVGKPGYAPQAIQIKYICGVLTYGMAFPILEEFVKVRGADVKEVVLITTLPKFCTSESMPNVRTLTMPAYTQCTDVRDICKVLPIENLVRPRWGSYTGADNTTVKKITIDVLSDWIGLKLRYTNVEILETGSVNGYPFDGKSFRRKYLDKLKHIIVYYKEDSNALLPGTFAATAKKELLKKVITRKITFRIGNISVCTEDSHEAKIKALSMFDGN